MKTEPTEAEAEPSIRRVEISNRTLLAVGLTLFGIWLLHEIVAVVVVVVVGLMIAGTVNPMISKLRQRGLKRWMAVFVVFFTVFGVFGVIGALTLPLLLKQVAQFLQHLPEHQANLARALGRDPLTDGLAASVSNYDLHKVTGSIDMVSALAFSGTVFELVGYAVSSIVLAIYFVSEPAWTRGALYSLVPRRFHVRVARVIMNLELIVGGYIRGQLLTSLFIGSFVLVMLTLLGIPNAVALATFASLADVIPFVGGLLATAPLVVMAFQKSAGTAGLVFVLMVIYQELESRIIVPRIYGQTLRLPPAAIVVALLVGGKLGGIVGALLALPTAAGIRMIVEELRVALPGDDAPKELERAADAHAERVYDRASAGASAQEAGKVAERIAVAQSEKKMLELQAQDAEAKAENAKA